MAIEYPNIPSTPSIRIIVIGTSGAGKTDFSKSLADILEVPHIELDAIPYTGNQVGHIERRQIIGI